MKAVGILACLCGDVRVAAGGSCFCHLCETAGMLCAARVSNTALSLGIRRCDGRSNPPFV